MADIQNEDLALALALKLVDDPELTVAELAVACKADEIEVVRVLDSHTPDGSFHGVGGGGGWVVQT